MIDEQPILEVSNLKIAYDDFIAVHDVSFSVNPGEIFGLLGPNGAGKTSTLSAIEGLVKPQQGSVRVVGFNISTQPLEARANFGVQLQASSFQKDLSIAEIIKLYAGLYGLSMDDEEIYKVIVAMNLESSAQKKTGELSGGQQQRAALATDNGARPAVTPCYLGTH
jgi:ABC-2 type transport system ATP-binding protein